MTKKIIVTGGSGRFGNILKKIKTRHKLFFPKKDVFDILNLIKIENYVNKTRPDIIIHLAGLSRPMSIHDKEIAKSIDLNIIGTANVTKVCVKKNIKLIYFSTNYVYQGKKGNYKESDPVLPINSYAWSKLGGETSVHLYKNSLILRVSMTEKPFVHKKAFANAKTSFLYQEDVAKLLFKILNKKGVLNVGGKAQNIYDFAKQDNKKIKKIFLKKDSKNFPKNSSINISRLKKIL
tara:strand:- start:2447 stop:3151 length:705 start_codon:yes stop_codon:yes gene_type:complete